MQTNVLLNMKAELLETLQKAAKQRSKRNDWIEYEQQQMTDAVNRLRARAAKLPVTQEAVAKVEQLAVGHSDYAEKFALYCAELVLD